MNNDINIYRQRYQKAESDEGLENAAVNNLLTTIEKLLNEPEPLIDYPRLNTLLNAVMHLRTYDRNDPVQVKLASLLTNKFRSI